MHKYDSYKDSGIMWIGEIPSTWDKCRLKSYCSLKGRIGWNGLRADEFQTESYAYLVTGQDFNSSDIAWDKCYQIDKNRYDEDPFIQLSNGDLLITKDGTIGKIAKVSGLDKPACLNSGIFVMKQKKQMYSQGYLYWLLCSSMLKDFNGYTSTGTTILHLYQNVFENMPMLVPSIEEQDAIAKYLDSKCSKTDKVISTQEKRIELLKELKQSVITRAVTHGIKPNVRMLDSGVEWIGKVPENWEVKRIKHIAKINGRVGYRGYTTADLVTEGEGAYTIGGKHISKNEIDLSDPEFISWNKYYESPEIMVKKGDIVTAQRGTLGRTAIVRDDIGEATINPSLVLVNGITIYNEFLYWYMVSDSVLSEIKLLNTSTAVPMISQNQIENISIPVPPDIEQKEIVNFIERKTKFLDSSITKALRRINLLKEYKQSLITEVVTGKRKVI